VGDPFLEKLLLEACLEAMETGAIVGIQDMGAAGLTCSTCEMGGRGNVGLEIELDLVPQRETDMTPYEIMLSESQERMLLVAEKGREQEVLSVFEKWGLDGVAVGTVIEEPRLRVFHHGELVADIPNQSLTDEAPLYHRPVGTWARPEQIKVPLDPPAEVLAELNKPRDYTADLKKLLASANICSKRWVFEQYDSMVQTNTVQGPGGEAGVMRIKGTNRGLAMALDGNGRWCYLDPQWGAALAVAEAARKVACTGATPVAATNCLNFGNPEKPEIMAQLSAAIDGISMACKELGTPITGGNVSLYNETRGEGIYPTPVIGIVGILDDMSKAVPSNFQRAGDSILLIHPNFDHLDQHRLRSFGSSEYAKQILHALWGSVPVLDLGDEFWLQKALIKLSEKRLIHSARDVSDGGLAVTLAESGFENGIGAIVHRESREFPIPLLAYFEEAASMVVVTCDPKDRDAVQAVIEDEGKLYCEDLGETLDGILDLGLDGKTYVAARISELRERWAGALESQLAEEVTA
jgi:phosphoribosylformylglycinamidine synthase